MVQRESIQLGMEIGRKRASSESVLDLRQTRVCKKRERVTRHGPVKGCMSLSTFPCLDLDRVARQAKAMLPTE